MYETTAPDGLDALALELEQTEWLGSSPPEPERKPESSGSDWLTGAVGGGTLYFYGYGL